MEKKPLPGRTLPVGTSPVRPLPGGFRTVKARVAELPGPSVYRQSHPSVPGPPAASARARFYENRRVVIGIAIAVAFHVSLGLAWWLTPPLRLKAGYAPERWVQILSVPRQDSQAPRRAAPPDPTARKPRPPASPPTSPP